MPRIRFRLRTLFVFVGVLAVVCGYLSERVYQLRQVRQAILAANGVGLVLEPEQANWLHWLGLRELRIRLVGVGFDSIPQRDWSASDVPRIEEVQVAEPTAQLSDMELHFLHHSLFMAKDHPALVNDSILLKLSPVADQLIILHLQNPSIDDTLVANLPRFTNLQILLLAESSITDQAITQIKHLSKLSYIDLRDTNITDKGLQELERLPNLNQVNLSGTRVTQAGVDRLQQLRPGLGIHWSQ